jgi:hypothetical protein
MLCSENGSPSHSSRHHHAKLPLHPNGGAVPVARADASRAPYAQNMHEGGVRGSGAQEGSDAARTGCTQSVRLGAACLPVEQAPRLMLARRPGRRCWPGGAGAGDCWPRDVALHFRDHQLPQCAVIFTANGAPASRLLGRPGHARNAGPRSTTRPPNRRR